jgi:hypothetical protein
MFSPLQTAPELRIVAIDVVADPGAFTA